MRGIPRLDLGGCLVSFVIESASVPFLLAGPDFGIGRSSRMTTHVV
jgi:hypothetical protein